MYLPYVLMYVIPLTAGILGFRLWKRRLEAAGKGLGTAYPTLKALFIFAAVFLGIFTFLAAGMTYANYRIFTEKRKAEVTERMGITAGKDVQFQHYFWGFGGPDGSNTRLTLTCTGDVRDMLEAHCLGEITKFSQDGYVWNAGQDPDDPDETPPGTYTPLTLGEITAFYEYKYRNKVFYVEVYDDNGKTRVVIM